MPRHYRYADVEQLKVIVSESLSFAEVARKMGRKPVGGTLTAIALRCKRECIDTSHMTGQAHSKGKVSNRRKCANEVLVLGEPTDYRQKATVLRRALFDLGVEHKCNICNINEWLGKKLVLEVDHIDGQYWNNVKHNLQFLCPNCHSLKE